MKDKGIYDHPTKLDKKLAKKVAGNIEEGTYERMKKQQKEDYYDY